jgi:hypothetical protein
LTLKHIYVEPVADSFEALKETVRVACIVAAILSATAIRHQYWVHLQFLPLVSFQSVNALKPEAQPVMLFVETVAVCCENHTEHINTLCGQNAETLYVRIQFVPHRKHITSPLQKPTA